MNDLAENTVPNSETEVVGWKVDRMTHTPHDLHIPTEIVEIRGKLYEVQGAGDPKVYEPFLEDLASQGGDFVVVPDFMSDKYTQPTFTLLVPVSADTETAMQIHAEDSKLSGGIFSDYQDAVRQASGRTMEERQK